MNINLHRNILPPHLPLHPAEDQVTASSDYDSTHEANNSDSSDVAQTEEDAEGGKAPGQGVLLHPMMPPEVRRGRGVFLHPMMPPEVRRGRGRGERGRERYT